MPNLPKETASILDNVREPGALADLIASNFPEEQASIHVRQRVLEAFDVKKRVELVLGMVMRQLEVLKVKDEISTLVHTEMSRSQRDYVLRLPDSTFAADAASSGAPTSSMPSHSAVFIVISRSRSRGVRSRPSTSSEIQLYENFNLELPQESQIATLQLPDVVNRVAHHY